MGLTIEDMKYLNEQFATVHSRINDVEAEIEEKSSATCHRLTEVETKINIHLDQAKTKFVTNSQKILTAVTIAGSYILFAVGQLLI